MNDAAKREPLSNVDAAWRHMEDPTNLMMVAGIFYFSKPIAFEKLKTVLQQRLLGFNRFRQRVVDTALIKTPHWEEDPDFSLDRHMTQIRLEGSGDLESFQDKCSELISTPLDFSRPLWHVHVIDNVVGGNAVFIRIHHCIADGIALVGVTLAMTDNSPASSMTVGPGKKVEPLTLSSTGNLFRQASNMLNSATKMSGKIFQEGVDTLLNPGKILDIAKLGTKGARDFANILFRSNDPETVLRGPLGVAKKVAWSKAVPLEQVKDIRRVTNATINDVLLTAMTGGLRRYLQHLGQSTKNLNFRAAVPVNLRPLERWHELGNHFGLVFLSLPVGLEDPLERLWELKRRMDYLKNSTEAVLAFGMLKAVGATPAEIQRLVVNTFGAKTTCVMTNVPGPREPLYMAGEKVDTMMFWVPCSGRVGMGISILSYNGEVRVGIVTDAALIPEPKKIIEGFYDEFGSMQDLVKAVDSSLT